MRPAIRPKTVALTIATMTSGSPVTSVMLATNEPGVTCWKNTPKKNPPTRPVNVTSDEISNETSVTASNLGARSARTGSTPITRNASSSSRIVRAPRSAQIAAAPDPETTRTVTNGPISFTVVTEAPVPDRSAAPNSTSSTLKRKTDSTVNGMAKNIAGSNDTRATNHVCSRNSRQAKGHLNIAAKTSSANATNSPALRTGASATPPPG